MNKYQKITALLMTLSAMAVVMFISLNSGILALYSFIAFIVMCAVYYILELVK